jgi:GT2 family glycosyltransferase
MNTSLRPVCSVCIANYNGIDLIGACIDSVLAQDCGFDIQIVVHDDASTDGSVGYIKTHYPQAILLDSQENVGFCIANNRMAAAAQGEYLLLLNNDAVLFPDALRVLHEAAHASAGPAILGLPQYDAATGRLIDVGSTFDLFLNPIPRLAIEPSEVGMVIGACLWIPRHLWIELGGFPDWFGSIAEDSYLCCLARLRGYDVRILATSGFRHWVGASLGGGKLTTDARLATSFARRARSERNKSFVIALVYPTLGLLLVFPLHLLLLLTEGILLSVIKRDMRFLKVIYLPCFVALWKERRRLRGLRKQVQASRRISPPRFFRTFALFPHKLRMLFRHGLPEVR